MSDHDEQPNLNPENPNPGWKDRDINMKIVIWSTSVVCAVALGTMVAMFYLVKTLNARELYQKGAVEQRQMPEGDVILQVDAAKDLQLYLDNEKAVLNNFGESGEGHVRVPIEVAKERMLAKGFPARDVPVPAAFTKPPVVSAPVDDHGKPAMEAHHGHDHEDHEGHDH